MTTILYHQNTQYEITIHGTVISIYFYNWTTPNPEAIHFRDLPEEVQEQIFNLLSAQSEEVE